jgi:hypothetical protein
VNIEAMWRAVVALCFCRVLVLLRYLATQSYKDAISVRRPAPDCTSYLEREQS